MKHDALVQQAEEFIGEEIVPVGIARRHAPRPCACKGKKCRGKCRCHEDSQDSEVAEVDVALEILYQLRRLENHHLPTTTLSSLNAIKGEANKLLARHRQTPPSEGHEAGE